jgi:hypothetical protein
MKNPIKNVALSFSCPAKWEDMISVGGNKFCDTCQHLVIDFTKLSQQEFDDAVKKNPGRLCGKFKSSQMSTRFLKYAAASAVVASVIVPTSCTTEGPLDAEKQSQPTQEIIEKETYTTMGIVSIPDSLEYGYDTIKIKDIDEDEYFKSE